MKMPIVGAKRRRGRPPKAGNAKLIKGEHGEAANGVEGADPAPSSSNISVTSEAPGEAGAVNISIEAIALENIISEEVSELQELAHTIDNMNQPVKRRGRPRGSTQKSLKSPSASDESPPKKRRGRKKKSEVLQETVSSVENSPQKRKRGRPPKPKVVVIMPNEITPSIPLSNIVINDEKNKNPDEVYEFIVEDEEEEIEEGEVYWNEEQLNKPLININDMLFLPVDEDRCGCCGELKETAHQGGSIACDQCNMTFKQKFEYDRHKLSCHGVGLVFDCQECSAKCADKGALARHLFDHTGAKPFNCKECNKYFGMKYHLDRHLKMTGCGDGNPKQSHPCQVCGKTFTRRDNLRGHLKAHAGQARRKKKYSCDVCNKVFHGASLLEIHMRTHTGERPYQCDFCTKAFPSAGSLRKHRRTHTGEKPYECKECFAKFRVKETLNRHMKTHTGHRPHMCVYCGKSFIQPSQLRAHVFHHTGEYGFTCDDCGKSFNRKTRLEMHIKFVHKNIKEHQCNVCSKTFVRKDDLGRHMNIHSGVKAHKCPICDKAFSVKNYLKLHLLTHTKEPPKSCDTCGRAFIRQDCLLRHMRKKHPEMLDEIMEAAEKKRLQQQIIAASVGQATESQDVRLSETELSDSIKELLSLLVDESTLKSFGWPETSVDHLLESVIRRCGHEPVTSPDQPFVHKLRENAKLLFTVVIDDSAVKTLLSNHTVDEVILHVLKLAKS